MLRPSGYFRGIDCPFLGAGGRGAGGPPCRRPHCHFRHPPAARGAAAPEPGAKPGAELGYDPYNPELPKPSTQIANGALGDIAVSTPSILQLELVNKAIEEVRYEVEREQKKYEELLETTKEYSTSEASSLISKTSVSAAVTKTDSLEYNPGSYNLNNNTDYNPTPLAAASSSKYTLDTFDNAKSKGSSLEYVPKVVAQPKKYSSVVPNNKYVIDDSKPSTDLEYDPLSNYSARLLSKASTKEQKGTKRRKVSSYGESYSPSRKKHCNVSNNYGTYAKFSDSEEDVDLEYQPTSVSRLQSKVSSENESSDGLSVKEKSTKLEDLNSREMKEMAVQYDMEDIESPRKNLVKDLSEKNTKLAKASSSKNEQNVEDKDSKEIAKDKMKKKKTDGSKPPCHKEMGKEKSKNTKKERTVKKEEKLKIKNGEKSCKEKSIKAKPDGNLKKSEKEKLEKVAKKEKSKSTSCAASSGKSKSEGLWKGASPEKLEGSTKDSIVKAADLKNGKQASRDKHKDKGGKTSASDRPKKKASPAKVGNSKGKCKPKQRTLSHVDLFGDESGEEEKVGQPPATFPNMSSDSDGDDGSCGFQSDNEGTKSIQRSKLSKSSSSSSSSDDIDYSVLEKDLDYDSDPMEECLRIFNESTDVKTEDKGRLGKQPLKEEASEEKMDDALTTLFPGQKRRISHLAKQGNSASLKRPVIPTEFGAKVPTNIRQRYLNLFIDECLKFCSSSQEAFDKALSEEKVAYERSTSRNIYLNVAVNTLKKLRSLVPNSPPCVNKTSNRKVVSHEAVLGGKLAAKTSFTLNQSGNLRAEDLTGAALYRRLKEYLLTEEQMKENGYPMPHPEKAGRAVVFTVEEKKTTDSSCRVCCRCGTEYMVSPSGNCIRKEECLHHWGRLRKQRVPGGWETHYSCCSGAVGSPGCQVAKQHVQDGRKENLEGFVKTFEKLPTTDGYPGIYALDCEMCYTKQGLELTRVTVINSDLKVVYDTFVKPDNKVVDYNTRFSGVTEEDLANASITLRDVQAVLLNMFSTDTILIGHSLESDLFALKLIHSTVVDTAVVFPHRLGLPYKRALRTLMADYLKRIIQDNVEGHDSSEDASACMELMIWKIKEDAKVKR
ncbi:RNA exonuclease 1 homolog isoform X5 [Chelonia mydas]|uniref:RNA exonuclease 1 homolog isoform X5 n=1 Tax=Chelonia mydas TaxID=8469 RepID=UPI0018A21D5A|nr:RNA exonuclease 1 homolog isoform X5 [Chelonia mydas]